MEGKSIILLQYDYFSSGMSALVGSFFNERAIKNPTTVKTTVNSMPKWTPLVNAAAW